MNDFQEQVDETSNKTIGASKHDLDMSFRF